MHIYTSCTCTRHAHAHSFREKRPVVISSRAGLNPPIPPEGLTAHHHTTCYRGISLQALESTRAGKSLSRFSRSSINEFPLNTSQWSRRLVTAAMPLYMLPRWRRCIGWAPTRLAAALFGSTDGREWAGLMHRMIEMKRNATKHVEFQFIVSSHMAACAPLLCFWFPPARPYFHV